MYQFNSIVLHLWLSFYSSQLFIFKCSETCLLFVYLTQILLFLLWWIYFIHSQQVPSLSKAVLICLLVSLFFLSLFFVSLPAWYPSFPNSALLWHMQNRPRGSVLSSPHCTLSLPVPIASLHMAVCVCVCMWVWETSPNSICFSLI